MGRTLPSYRVILEKERANWKKVFCSKLRDQDIEYFNALWDYAFLFADAASTNSKPIFMENILLSMLLGQQKEIERLKREIVSIKKGKSIEK